MRPTSHAFRVSRPARIADGSRRPGDTAEHPINRDGLIAAITAFLAGQHPDALDDIRGALAQEIDRAGASVLSSFGARLARAGADWTYYEHDPLARRIHHLLADRLLDPESELRGTEFLDRLDGRPVVVVANHLSYSDANLFEILLHRGGGDVLARRLTVVAGPKVYSSLQRRFSSLCFGTIKVPQSASLSSEDAVMSPREVARAARRCIEAARERMAGGDALLVFPEGRRSRAGDMQPLLAGVTRYFEMPGTLILPVAITGTEALFPIGEETLHPVRIVGTIGPPIDANALRLGARGDRRLMIDAAGIAIATLLPAEYRGAYGDDVVGLAEARQLRERLLE